MTGKERGEREREGIGRWGGVRREKTNYREWVEREDRDCGGVHIAGGRRGEERENEKMTASEREAGAYG